MQVPIESIGSAQASPAALAYGQLPDPQAVDLAALAQPGAANSAFATLAAPPPTPAFTAGGEWVRTAQTVGDALTNGVNRPHLKEMEDLLKQSVSSGQPASPEQLMLVSLRLQEGSALSTFLSQAVNNTRQSLQTLIERS